MLAIKISFLYLIYVAEGHLNEDLLSISITRHNKGDVFNVQGEKYHKELCAGLSGGTAEASEENDFECRCQQQHPVYRDDLNVCVDDIQECSLVPFVSGTSIKKIPYVFLPLKGQIVYPSAEIVVSESGSPVCVVSGGQYLGRNGWMNLRNNSDTEPPFRLFRDEGRTYLQWFGESSMRMAMEGRIILVHLMCKDASFPEEPRIFTPCIAFRVAGNPSVREVMFAADVQLTPEHNTGLSKREYVAIGLCSLFLAIVYVASIFLYMHWRKQRQRKNKKKIDEDTQLTLGEEGIVKNNPLLQANRHLGVCEEDNAGYMTDSNSCGSDHDRISDLLCLDEDEVATHQNVQTSAIVHPCDLAYGETTLNQDPNSIERLPEENVSIIETLESKEVHPETIKAIVSANGRRKLYFNPSYFDPELLKAPPPAALEFLVKIREVIAIAKHKMSNKKFSPSLLGIPEEEGSLKTESNAMGRNVGSVIEEKTRHEPFAETKARNMESVNGDGVEKNEFCCSSDAKQKIIQRWLEDVPVMMPKSVQGEKSNQSTKQNFTENKILKKSEFWQTNETVNQTAKQENKNGVWPKKQEKRRPSTKTRPPPLPPQQSAAPKINREKPARVPKTDTEEPKTVRVSNEKNHEEDDKISGDFTRNFSSLEQSSPSSSNETSNNIKEDEDSTSATKQQETISSLQNPTKNLMDAVIQELTGIKKPKKSYNEETKELSNSATGIQKWECSCENINELMETKKSKMETENKITDNKTKDSIKIINKRNLETVRDNNFNNDDNNNNNNNSNNNNNNNQDNNKNKNNNNNSNNFSEVVRNGQTKKANHSNGTQDEHEYEIILLNGEVQVPNPSKKNTKGYNLSEVFSKSKRNEGYSLVSEVYVNDGNNSCDGESPTTRLSNPATQETEKISYEVMNEKTSRLTIHVKDSPRQNKEALCESDNFEPDTLERKQGKCKSVQRIENESDTFDRYSNQRFHDLDRRKKGNSSENNENFTDSLERPTILLKTNGSFKRNSLEKDVNELFRNLNWARMENFGSLREIYEAKSRNHRRRTETTSLIDSVNSESDCISTLSWSEERRNKLLHRGIVLHIDEDIRGQTKGRHSHNESPFKPSPPSRSDPKPQVSRSRILFAPKTSTNDISASPLRSPSPPVPPPRSLPVSPEPQNGRSTTPSPVNGIEGRKTARDTPSPPLPFSSLSSFTSISNNASNNNNNNNTVVRVFTKSECRAQCHSFLGSSVPKAPVTPPRPPKVSLITASSPPLPPRSSKPPLPPKNSKSRSKKESSKFASRPLPPLPLPRPNKNSDFPKDLETLSTLSGASADSLNSSEYESFYTLPYEGEEEADWKVKNEVTCLNNSPKNFSQSNRIADTSITGSLVSTKHQQRKPIGHQLKSQRIHDPEKKSLRKRIKAAQNKVEDSGYLSTDSSESYCPQILLPSHIPRIPEGVESSGGQNSETEESICDGASESGAESTATDSFFYGHFNKGNGAETQSKSPGSQVYSYSLRLSDVEVNSDTERHCVPIMVRP